MKRFADTTYVFQHIQDIVGQWKEELKSCHLIFYRAVGPQNRSILFGGKSPPFDKSDERLRSIPFPTRRATFNEVKRVHGILSALETHGKYLCDDLFDCNAL